MFKIFLVFYFLFFFEGYSQKFGYVNSEFILNSMPEYKEALSEIDNLSKAWEKEVSDMYIDCLLYTSPSPRDGLLSRMPSSA